MMAYSNAVPLVKCSICGAVQWLSDECEVCESKLVFGPKQETSGQKISIEKFLDSVRQIPNPWDNTVTCFNKTSMVDSSSVSEALDAFWKSAEVSTGVPQDKMYLCSTPTHTASDLYVKNAAVINVE